METDIFYKIDIDLYWLRITDFIIYSTIHNYSKILVELWQYYVYEFY